MPKSFHCKSFHCAIALILSLGVTVPCAAQNQPAPPGNPTAPGRDPKACSNQERSRDGSTGSQSAERGNQNLSEKLEQTEGVICPPDIDPEIRAPTPGGGKMPVIPRPGSPGGDPTVRPK